MLRILTSLLFLLPFTLAAQTGSTFSIGTGLFFFGGNAAVKNSFLVSDNTKNTSYINNPYGKKPGFSFNISQDIHRCTKNRFLFGMSLGGNYLRAISNLEQIDYTSENLATVQSKAVFRIYDAAVLPYIGKRFKINDLEVDIAGGAEFAFPVYSEEKAEIKTRAGYKIQTERKRNVISRDIRPTLRINTFYNNVGFFASYSHGLSNYAIEISGADPVINSRIIKFGFNYRFQKS